MIFSEKIDPEEIILELKKLIELFSIKNRIGNNEKNISDPPKN